MGAIEVALPGAMEAKVLHHLLGLILLNSEEDSVRWIVWLGRYALDRQTRVPNALLIRVRNPE